VTDDDAPQTVHPESRVSLVNPSGRSCRRTDSLLGDDLDKFQLVFRQVLESLFIERMKLIEELFTDYMDKPDLQDLVSKWIGSQVYDRLSRDKPRPSRS
jgi:hypothetical protein